MRKIPPNRLRQLREERGWKPYDIAAQLRVDPSTVARWERGDGTIPDPVKFDLAELFDVSVIHLMGWEENGSSPKRSRGKAAA